MNDLLIIILLALVVFLLISDWSGIFGLIIGSGLIYLCKTISTKSGELCLNNGY